MSRKQSEDSGGLIGEVLVRTQGGQPVRIAAVAVRGNVVLVRGPRAARPLPYPREHVFRFDAAVFDAAERAYKAENAEALAAAWASARPFGVARVS